MNELNILLTGSTGFLGGKLIENLIINKENHLFLIVRNVEKAQKLKQTFEIEQQERMHILPGDITAANLGLNDSTLNRLEGKIDVFYHLAALVKFDYDLRDELFTINYQGTKNALDIAVLLQTKKFHYISTAYTVGKRKIAEERLYSIDAEYNNPYEESKVKAEHLVYKYKEKLDISIFRPAIIVGDSITGEADSQFTLYGFIRALSVFKQKVLRKENDKNVIYRILGSEEGNSNFVPVDYVADILSLAVTKSQPDQIYHITNPSPPTNSLILSTICEVLCFKNLRMAENVSEKELSKEEKQLNHMIGSYSPYLSSAIKFEDQNTRKLISNSSIEHLKLTTETVQMIIDAYYKLPVDY